VPARGYFLRLTLQMLHIVLLPGNFTTDMYIAETHNAIYESLVQTVKALHLDIEVDVNTSGCTARCTDGPLVRICIPGKKDVVYTNVTPECIMGILKEQIPGLAVPE